MTTPQPTGSGLATWRRRKAEEKKEFVAALDKLREEAVTVEREGREFRLIRIPDRYGWGAAIPENASKRLR
jgi:hypothetical protein